MTFGWKICHDSQEQRLACRNPTKLKVQINSPSYNAARGRNTGRQQAMQKLQVNITKSQKSKIRTTQQILQEPSRKYQELSSSLVPNLIHAAPWQTHWGLPQAQISSIWRAAHLVCFYSCFPPVNLIMNPPPMIRPPPPPPPALTEPWAVSRPGWRSWPGPCSGHRTPTCWWWTGSMAPPSPTTWWWRTTRRWRCRSPSSSTSCRWDKRVRADDQNLSLISDVSHMTTFILKHSSSSCCTSW